jgi:hypothetical protein
MLRDRGGRHETLESSFDDSVCSCGCSRWIRADSRATRLQRTCDTIIEEFAATTARKLAVPSAYRQLRNPIMPSTENIRGGMEHSEGGITRTLHEIRDGEMA